MTVKARWICGITASLLALLAAMTVGLSVVHGQATQLIAHGGGTTIIHSGTGSPGFVPVITTIAFHATRNGSGVTGSFECLAEAPEASTGSKSAQFTVNAMYVTGEITAASVRGDTATLTGTANITRIGLQRPFHIRCTKGGPGATSVLTVDTLPTTPFHEILLQGSFEVAGEN